MAVDGLLLHKARGSAEQHNQAIINFINFINFTIMVRVGK